MARQRAAGGRPCARQRRHAGAVAAQARRGPARRSRAADDRAAEARRARTPGYRWRSSADAAAAMARRLVALQLARARAARRHGRWQRGRSRTTWSGRSRACEGQSIVRPDFDGARSGCSAFPLVKDAKVDPRLAVRRARHHRRAAAVGRLADRRPALRHRRRRRRARPAGAAGRAGDRPDRPGGAAPRRATRSTRAPSRVAKQLVATAEQTIGEPSRGSSSRRRPG